MTNRISSPDAESLYDKCDALDRPQHAEATGCEPAMIGDQRNRSPCRRCLSLGGNLAARMVRRDPAKLLVLGM